MKTYEYQILRYIPDQISGEFLNVGILMVGPKERTLYYEFIHSRQRISAAFHSKKENKVLTELVTPESVGELLKGYQHTTQD